MVATARLRPFLLVVELLASSVFRTYRCISRYISRRLLSTGKRENLISDQVINIPKRAQISRRTLTRYSTSAPFPKPVTFAVSCHQQPCTASHNQIFGLQSSSCSTHAYHRVTTYILPLPLAYPDLGIGLLPHQAFLEAFQVYAHPLVVLAAGTQPFIQ